MYLGHIFIFGILFFSCAICTIIFKNYRKDLIISRKTVPIPFMAGLSMLIVDTIFARRKKAIDKTVYWYRVKVTTFILMSFLLCTVAGFVYFISLEVNHPASIFTLTRPDAGEGSSSLTIMTENDAYTGPIDINIDERQYTFDETIDIFNKYREEFDTSVLGDNDSFLHITSPLFFPATIGTEGIAVSWHIENTDIITYDGKLNESVSEVGVETDITATWTLGDISADICYHIKVFPPKKDAKTKLKDFIESQINSEENLHSSQITLPQKIDGTSIKYSEYSEILPP